MRAFTTLVAVAAPMMVDNIDTDQIIPSSHMRSTGKSGLAAGLFARWRTNPDGTPDPAFVLNRAEYAGAQILIAGANFGAGSSREHAVWALVEAGFRAVIAASFSPIFAANAVRNGLLPVALETAAIARWVEADPQAHQIAIDLPAQTLAADTRHHFAIDAEAKAMLLGGLDAIALTLSSAAAIADWRTNDRARRPWVYEIVR